MTPTQINPTVFLLTAPSPPAISVPGLYCVLRCWEIQVMENRTLSRNWDSETKSPTQTQNSNSASTLTNRHQEVELLSFPLHRRAIIHSQRISLSFWPASWERGRKCGCFWSSALCVCEYLLISHQWGKLQHLFLFLAGTWHTASLFWLWYATNSGRQVFWQHA